MFPSPAQTHASVRTMFLTTARLVAQDLTMTTCPHDIAQSDRVRELLLLGMQLCDEQMGSPTQIQDLIKQRVNAIEAEIGPFNPDPFQSCDLGTQDVVEEDAGLAHDFRARLFWEGATGDQSSSNRSENAPRAPINALPPEKPSENETDWIDGFESSATDILDPDSPSVAAVQRSGRRQQVPDPRIQAWEELDIDLSETLEGYIELHSDNPDKGLDYHETISTLNDAIATAHKRPKGADLDELWRETEESLLAFDSIERRRREYPQPMNPSSLSGSIDDYEDKDENVQRLIREVEAEDASDEEVLVPATPTRPLLKRRISNAFPHTYNWELTTTTVKRVCSEEYDTLDYMEQTHSPTSDNPTAHDQQQDGDLPTNTNEAESSIPVPPITAGSQPDIESPERKHSSLSSSKSSPQTPPACPSHHTTQVPNTDIPAPSRIHTFSPILHANTPMRSTQPIVQKFYRQTVQHTLDQLLNNTTSTEVREVVNAYRAHVEREVPAPAPSQPSEERATKQIRRLNWLKIFRTPMRKDVNDRGFR